MLVDKMIWQSGPPQGDLQLKVRDFFCNNPVSQRLSPHVIMLSIPSIIPGHELQNDQCFLLVHRLEQVKASPTLDR